MFQHLSPGWALYFVVTSQVHTLHREAFWTVPSAPHKYCWSRHYHMVHIKNTQYTSFRHLTPMCIDISQQMSRGKNHSHHHGHTTFGVRTHIHGGTTYHPFALFHVLVRWYKDECKSSCTSMWCLVLSGPTVDEARKAKHNNASYRLKGCTLRVSEFVMELWH